MSEACSPTTLYRFFAADGTLLYVGITGCKKRRFGQHAQQAEWWLDAASVTLEHFADRNEAMAAEEAAIKAERPRFNDRHNPVRRADAPHGYMTCQAAADALRCSVAHVSRLISSGVLRERRDGRRVFVETESVCERLRLGSWQRGSRAWLQFVLAELPDEISDVLSDAPAVSANR